MLRGCKTENQLRMQAECSHLRKQTTLRLKRNYWPSSLVLSISTNTRTEGKLLWTQITNLWRQYLENPWSQLPDVSKRCSCVFNVMILTYITRRDLKCTWRIHSADTSAEMKYTWSGQTEDEIEEMPKIEDINQMVASEDKMARLKEETSKDEALQAVKAAIQRGWPESKSSLPAAVNPYFQFRDELVEQEGLILRGDRVVIPNTLRKETIQDLHAAHQGIESTLRKARESIYWPNMNNEVKDYISRCDTCLTYAPRQQKEPLLSHKVPDRPWAKVATDLFQFENKDYLVTIDYLSDFFEVDRLYSTTSETVIKKLKGHFARYGIPDEVISDNGSQFTAEEFRVFAQAYGFKHTCTSPHHPQSNGKAESAVKQAKKTLRMARVSGNDFCLALLNVRNTPQEGYNMSPAQRMMSRSTKTLLPVSTSLLKPHMIQNTTDTILKKQAKQQRYYNRGAKTLEQLHKGDRVKLQPFTLGKKDWADGQ